MKQNIVFWVFRGIWWGQIWLIMGLLAGGHYGMKLLPINAVFTLKKTDLPWEVVVIFEQVEVVTAQILANAMAATATEILIVLMFVMCLPAERFKQLFVIINYE